MPFPRDSGPPSQPVETMPDTGNAMRDQVFATPGALKAAFADMERAARLVLTTPEIYRSRRIVLTGSGDSLFAAKAAEMALLQHTGLAIEVRPPMEAGRYHADASRRADLENTLVVALSNSGAAARVVEAASLYRARGANVLAITRDSDSLLATAAGKALVLPAPTPPSGAGFGSYLLAFLALALLAIRIGEVRIMMTMDQAQALKREIEARLDELARVISASDGPARELAANLQGAKLFEFVGAGPSYAVSEYGAAKVLEASGRHALARELEEWTHLNYFDGAPEDIATQMTIPRGSRADSRAVELLAYMSKLGRSVTVIGAGEAADAARRSSHTVIDVDSDIAEAWAPLLLSAPHALFAAHFAELSGAEYGRGGKGRWEDSADASTVQKSRMWDGGK
jgi:glucosamine--fructose-6-phosphate aminotransferase (isomerizing)